MFETLLHQFVRQMQDTPGATALVCIDEAGGAHSYTRAEFLAEVQVRATGLREQEIVAGEPLLIALPHGIDLFASFWATLLVGAVPVIHPYPGALDSRNGFAAQVGEFARQIKCQAVLCAGELNNELLQVLKGTDIRVVRIPADGSLQSAASLEPVKVSSLEEPAILQFSSGATGAKKGVVISHRALLNYLATNEITLRLTPEDVFVSWLPLNHDMGLIACFTVPLTSGLPLVIMSPQYWIAHPGALFRAVHHYRGSITFMPNFAFSYCSRAVRDTEIAEIDLSSWRILVSGGEPARIEAMEAFSRRFAPRGLQPMAMRVGYGLAECVLGVSRTPLGKQPQVDWVDQKALIGAGQAVPCSRDAAHAKAIVSCGKAHPIVELDVVSESGQSLREREVGEIRVRSTALFSGYYLQPGLTEEAMRDGWFHTGDLGYLHDGELYVCGRKKDLIISFGSNIYPEDVEAIAESFEEVRRGRAVAFGIDDERRQTEKIVLVCETQPDFPAGQTAALALEIRERAWQRLGVVVAQVEFVKRGWVIKTTSGKLTRSANREKYLAELG